MIVLIEIDALDFYIYFFNFQTKGTQTAINVLQRQTNMKGPQIQSVTSTKLFSGINQQPQKTIHPSALKRLPTQSAQPVDTGKIPFKFFCASWP